MKKTTYINGVTIIELLITVAIIAILMIIATVMYTSQIRNGRRIDAINTLFSMALAEENYRSTNTTYGTLAQAWNGVTTSAGGYYTLTITEVSATAYTITATATGDQLNDAEGSTSCTPLILTLSSGTTTKSPSVCWPA